MVFFEKKGTAEQDRHSIPNHLHSVHRNLLLQQALLILVMPLVSPEEHLRDHREVRLSEHQLHHLCRLE